MGGQTWEKTRRKVSARSSSSPRAAQALRAAPGAPRPRLPARRRRVQGSSPPSPSRRLPTSSAPSTRLAATWRSRGPWIAGLRRRRLRQDEVALRAAFKAVSAASRWQCWRRPPCRRQPRALRRALQGWPVRVAALSRFESRADQLEVLKKLGEKQIDIVVGTHRLLPTTCASRTWASSSRRGAALRRGPQGAPEEMRTQVDVLTLTATPIPRTMNMALMGCARFDHRHPAGRSPGHPHLRVAPDDDVIRGAQARAGAGGQSFSSATASARQGERGERSDESAGGPDPAPPVGGSRPRRRPVDRSWAEKIRELVPQRGSWSATGRWSRDPREGDDRLRRRQVRRAGVTTIVERPRHPRANTCSEPRPTPSARRSSTSSRAHRARKARASATSWCRRSRPVL